MTMTDIRERVAFLLRGMADRLDPEPRMPARSTEESDAVRKIRGQLLLQGETIVSWATRRGYPPATVQRVIHRWTRPGTDRGLPRGAMTRAILRDLSTDTGVTIPAGMDWATRPPAITQIPRRRAAGTE